MALYHLEGLAGLLGLGHLLDSARASHKQHEAELQAAQSAGQSQTDQRISNWAALLGLTTAVEPRWVPPPGTDIYAALQWRAVAAEPAVGAPAAEPALHTELPLAAASPPGLRPPFGQWQAPTAGQWVQAGAGGKDKSVSGTRRASIPGYRD